MIVFSACLGFCERECDYDCDCDCGEFEFVNLRMVNQGLYSGILK